MLRRHAVLLAGLLLAACAAPRPRPVPAPVPPPRPATKPLARLGFTIQAGAFAKVENASRLAEALQAKGLEAIYYAARPGLYRVRFGDFPTREAARTKAEALKTAGVIQDFYLAAPEEPSLERPVPRSNGDLRANLVATAQGYLGVPYLWGGTTPQGFDCSGLALAVYRLNGLELPRASRDQYEAGQPVPQDQLRPGDLVFFATAARGEVSHVGIFIGGDLFIHAPGRGHRITRDHLGEAYFKERYLGGRSYLS
jgi:cell wall-associated NlpC family hydrolase